MTPKMSGMMSVNSCDRFCEEPSFCKKREKRSDIVKLRDCEVAIQHCDIELQALATSFKEHFPGKPLPEGIDPLGTSIFCHFIRRPNYP